MSLRSTNSVIMQTYDDHNRNCDSFFLFKQVSLMSQLMSDETDTQQYPHLNDEQLDVWNIKVILTEPLKNNYFVFTFYNHNTQVPISFHLINVLQTYIIVVQRPE